jgi:hypothetical protein
MESEKIMYWVTLGVLAMATATGFVTEHRGWGDRLVDRSVAVVSQASDVAAHYAEMADLMLGRGENDLATPAHAVIDIQNDGQDDVQAEVQAHLACARRTLVRRQAQLVRLQAIRVQVRALKRAPRTIVLPHRNMVIEIPQAPERPE